MLLRIYPGRFVTSLIREYRQCCFVEYCKSKIWFTKFAHSSIKSLDVYHSLYVNVCGGEFLVLGETNCAILVCIFLEFRVVIANSESRVSEVGIELESRKEVSKQESDAKLPKASLQYFGGLGGYREQVHLLKSQNVKFLR